MFSKAFINYIIADEYFNFFLNFKDELLLLLDIDFIPVIFWSTLKLMYHDVFELSRVGL